MLETSFSHHKTLSKSSRFFWLMGLYTENYSTLDQLFAPNTLACGRYISQLPGQLPLNVDIVARHRYTIEMFITYSMQDDHTHLEFGPSARIRVYCDTQQVETTHCDVSQHLQRALLGQPTPIVTTRYRLHINTFLGKWLDYLLACGHSTHTLYPLVIYS